MTARPGTLPALDAVLESLVTGFLGRPPAALPVSRLHALIHGKRVLVTGAGGSIGSEICRQVATFDPASLVMLDRYENGLHRVAPDLADCRCARAEIADITDPRRLDRLFTETSPHLVLHAAAHKHVPLMEANSPEAVKNNVTGTRLVAEAAVRHGVGELVLISTDKAVRPSSVMGATKRVAELVVQHSTNGTATRGVAVRFGNVLGSNGSVLHTFLDQIRRGGPVTVTHPEVRRYFMLTEEAVHLVLHAAAAAPHGMAAVLDLGEQRPVLEFAHHLIRVAGLVPDVDIPVVFTGLRPGEKLIEELTGSGERLCASPVPGIDWVQSSHAHDWRRFARDLEFLELSGAEGHDTAVRQALLAIVPEFSGGAVATASGVCAAAEEPA